MTKRRQLLQGCLAPTGLALPAAGAATHQSRVGSVCFFGNDRMTTKQDVLVLLANLLLAPDMYVRAMQQPPLQSTVGVCIALLMVAAEADALAANFIACKD